MDHHDQIYRALRNMIITLAIGSITVMLSVRWDTLTGVRQVWASVIILGVAVVAVGMLACNVFRWVRWAMQNRRNKP